VVVPAAPAATAPAPTPTPSPTPTATPTPTASIPKGYGAACDGFSVDRRSYAISAEIRLTRVFRAPVTPDVYYYSIVEPRLANFSSDLLTDYRAATRTASLLTFPDTPVYSFPGSTIVETTPAGMVYRRGQDQLDLSCPAGSSIQLQRRSLSLEDPSSDVATAEYRATVSGVPTATLAELSSGTYQLDLPIRLFRTDDRTPNRTEAVSALPGSSITFDATTGTLKGRVELGGTKPVSLTIEIPRMIGTRFGPGTVVASDGSKGEIIGGFHGPQGREIAVALVFEKFGIHYVGAGRGIR
jgi:hypothetical protein